MVDSRGKRNGGRLDSGFISTSQSDRCPMGLDRTMCLNLELRIATGMGGVGTVAHITRAWGGRFALQGSGGVIVPRNGI